MHQTLIPSKLQETTYILFDFPFVNLSEIESTYFTTYAFSSITLLYCIGSVIFKMLNYCAARFDSFLFISWIYVGLQSADGVPNDSCNITKPTIQICEGSDTYIPYYPDEYGQNELEVKPILTFLNLADFDPDEKIITVFVSLKLEWNDMRLSLNTYELVNFILI